MKNFKILKLILLIIAFINTSKGFSQIDIGDFPRRTQNLNQYTSVFICSPNNGTIIQNIHNDDDQEIWFNSDKFQYYDNGWVYLAEETPTTTMQPAKAM